MEKPIICLPVLIGFPSYINFISRQANVSAFYRRPAIDEKVADEKEQIKKHQTENNPVSGPSITNKYNQDQSHKPDIIDKFKESIAQQNTQCNTEIKPIDHGETASQKQEVESIKEELMDTDESKRNLSFSSESRQYLERRLKIEEEVTFVSVSNFV